MLLFSIPTIAQSSNEILNYDFRLFNEKHTAKLTYQNHTAVKPLRYNEISFLDSTDKFGIINLSFNNFSKSSNVKFHIAPLLSVGYSKDFAIDSSYFSMGTGLKSDISIGTKWNASLSYFTENSSQPGYIGNIISANNVVPSMGYASPTSLGNSAFFFSGFVNYTPNPFFEFRAGVGKNFIGDGYRSLLLSDNAFQYPYFRINTNFWKLQYTNLFCMMDQLNVGIDNSLSFVKKFATIHHLDWNIGKRVSLGIFESIVWQAKDTLYNRQFDVNYLNPIIFYRPVEYSLGSSDNALLGMNFKLKISNHYQLYSQFILDEFLLKEVLDGRGWWANKYGFQFGAKAIEPFKIEGLFIQSEFNVVRPYTYSHVTVNQNYGHYNQSLAHPIGANFWESVSIVKYQKKNWIFSNQTNVSLYGTDSNYLSYGGNIYQSYVNRPNDYYNRIGQGVSNHLFFNRFSVSYMIDPRINLRFEIAHIYRHITTQHDSNEEHFISIGIKTNLWNSYTDY